MQFNDEQLKILNKMCFGGAINVGRFSKTTEKNKVSLSFLSDKSFVEVLGERTAKEYRKYVCVNIKKLEALYDLTTIPSDISDGLYLLLTDIMPSLKNTLPPRDVSALESRYRSFTSS